MVSTDQLVDWVAKIIRKFSPSDEQSWEEGEKKATRLELPHLDRNGFQSAGGGRDERG